jgi:hypothetical protein
VDPSCGGRVQTVVSRSACAIASIDPGTSRRS